MGTTVNFASVSNPMLSIDHPRQFAAGHAIDVRHLPFTDHRTKAILKYRTLHAFAAQWIGAIKNNELDAGIAAGLHRNTHRADVRIGAAAGVLQIVNDRVESFEHFGSGTSIRSVKRIHLEPGPLIHAVLDVRAGKLAAINAVLRSEQGHESNAGRGAKRIDCRFKAAIDARRIR